MTAREKPRPPKITKKNTCPLLTLRHLADYKDTVNGVILTQQWEGGKEESTRVRGQGARLSCRSASHLPWLMGFSGCRSRRAHGGRIWGWLIALSSEPRVGSSGVLRVCKYTWAQRCTGNRMKWRKRLNKRTRLWMFRCWRLVSIMSQWEKRICHMGNWIGFMLQRSEGGGFPSAARLVLPLESAHRAPKSPGAYTGYKT